MNEPLAVYSCVYVLKLENENWYVGITYNLNLRMAQHWSGNGAKWTKLHKPISIEKVIYPASTEIENQTTLDLMEHYGKEKVRGGNYCKI
jgi:predicted GIY-YIG superfamily endonuclease